MAETSEMVAAESIDWLTVSSPQIALAVLTELHAAAEPHAATTLTLRISQTLKGHPPAGATVKLDGAFDGSVGDEFVAFFDAARAERVLISLTRVAEAGTTLALSSTFAVLRTRREILDAVTRRMRREAPAAPASLRLEIPAQSDARALLAGDGSAYLVVPADPELGPAILAHTFAQDVWERARSAHQLAAYPNDASIRRLIEMLEDPGTATLQTVGGPGAGRREVYPARQAAYDVLSTLRVPIAEPQSYWAAFPRDLLEVGSRAIGWEPPASDPR